MVEKQLDPVQSNVSLKRNCGGAILEASRILMAEAFLVFIYLRSDRRNTWPSGLGFFVCFCLVCFFTGYLHKGKERDGQLDFGGKK